MKASDIPDTAIKLFDAQEDTVAVPDEAVTTLETSFFSESQMSGQEFVVSDASTDSLAQEDASFFQGSNNSEVQEEPLTTDTPVEIVSVPTEPLDVSEVTVEVITEAREESIVLPITENDDIYAPVRKAIAEYDALIARIAKNAEMKDKEISDWNTRVAEAKAAAKKALDKRKKMEDEMDRINAIRTVFTAQLK